MRELRIWSEVKEFEDFPAVMQSYQVEIKAEMYQDERVKNLTRGEGI